MDDTISYDLANNDAASPGDATTISVFTNSATDAGNNPLIRVTTNGDTLLKGVMPQAEYMYGCTPTAVGMLLAYYDLYGYRGNDYSNMIAGTVSLKSRGSDGNKGNMNEFDTALGRAIASKDYVDRFVSKTPEEELQYSFTNGGEGPDIRTDVWNCLADYLGTGQYWRGTNDLATSMIFGSLSLVLSWNGSSEMEYNGIERDVDWRYSTMLYGLYLYVDSRGYSLDEDCTHSYMVDLDGGPFTFEDYMAEIDAGRPVLISITEHSMVGYGYNEETREIIFDDCYEADRRMTWDGTYYYSGAYRRIEGMTVIRLKTDKDVDLVLSPLNGAVNGTVLSVSGGPLEPDGYSFLSDSVSVNFTVANTGTSISDPFAVSIYVDDQLVKTISHIYLEGNSSREFKNVTLDGLGVGLHKIRIVADERHFVEELSRTNNTLEQKLTVLKDGANIVTGIQQVESGVVSLDDYVMSGWQLHVLNGGTASGTLVQGKVTDISSDGIISFLPGLVMVSQGGLLQDAAVYEYGQIQIEGSANDLHVYENGTVIVSSGGTASDILAGPSGIIQVESGGLLAGRIQVEKGAWVTLEEGAVLHFDLTGATTTSAPQVSGLSYISGNYSCTLTIDASSMPLGQYRIAEGASSFNRTITVSDTSGTVLGTLSIGKYFTTDDEFLYSLKRSQNVLLLNKKNIRPQKPVVSADVTTITNSDVFLSAEFSDDSFMKEYSLDGKNWYIYKEPVRITKNCTVFFRARNEEGLISEIAPFLVENIDRSFVSGLNLTSGQSADVYSGETYFQTVLTGGILYVQDGGLANSATVGESGSMLVYSGGKATNPVVESGGSLEIFSGGTATNVAWTPCVGKVRVNSGAAVEFASEYSGVYYGSGDQLLSQTAAMDSLTVERASMYVMSGGTANYVSVGFSGHLYAFGGTVYGGTVLSGGTCFASDGGILSSVTVNNGGKITVSSGGTAVKILENGGFVTVWDGAEATFAVHTLRDMTVRSSATVHSGTTADGTIVSGGILFVYDGGKLTGKTTCLDRGIVSACSGAVIDFDLTQTVPGAAARINDFSRIQGGAPVYTITVNSSQQGGTYRLAEGVSKFDGVISVVNTAGTELETITAGDTKSILGVSYTLSLSNNALSLEIGKDASSVPATSTGLVLSKGTRTIEQGQLYLDSLINSGGVLRINDGGRADVTVVNSGGTVCVSGGGQANVATVNSGGVMYVYDGGSATRVRENGGQVEVQPGAEENVTFVPNAYSNYVQIMKGATLHSGTTACKTTLKYNATLRVYSGGSAVEATVSSGGQLHVSDGGRADGTTVASEGFLHISGGGIGDGVTIQGGGRLYIRENGRLTGHVTFEDGAFVSAYESSILDFDLTQTSAGAAALVNDLSAILGTPLYTLTVDGNQESGSYALAAGAAGFKGTVTVRSTTGNDLGTLTVGAKKKIDGTDYTLKLTGNVLSVTVDAQSAAIIPEKLVGTKDRTSWSFAGAGRFVVEYSTDRFEHAIGITAANPAIDLMELPAGTCQWRVSADGGKVWSVGADIISDNDSTAPKAVRSNADGAGDIFFASPDETWTKSYFAMNAGSANDWAGTGEIVSAKGRNRIHDLFFGSSDLNILCLTDTENGDALFVDDEFTDLPDSVAEQQSRLARIREIRAGGGDDIVDMTSQRFEYIGDGLTIRGGNGNDVIWANKGGNFLFGDAGNDRITGASGDDLIAGGVGNDAMHGGGGNDIFTFCENWGADTVEQLADGWVTLWFASGESTNWNAETLTYADENGSVTVSGIDADRITLKFGSSDDPEQFAALSETGAFADFSSQKIFEKQGTGILATL